MFLKIKKITFQMRKLKTTLSSIITGFSFLFISLTTIAQQHSISDRLSIKLGAGLINAEPYKYENKIVQARYKPQVGIALQYEVFTHFDAGVYIAYSNIGHMLSYDIKVVDNLVVSATEENVPSHTLYYGLNFNYHLLPLLLKNDNLRFDVYPIASMGLVSRSWGEMDGTEVKIDPFLEYHFGLGLGYKFSPRFELFGEYSLGRFYNEGKSKISCGLAYFF